MSFEKRLYWPAVGLALALSLAGLWLTRSLVSRLKPPRAALVVCVDPGHPTAFNSGKRLVNGLTELDTNWSVALKLEDRLKRMPCSSPPCEGGVGGGVQVVVTRRVRDQLMSTVERAMAANQAQADLLISLHCDYGRNNGFTVYYPNRQGEDLGVTGPTWSVIEASRHAAYAISSGMASVIGPALKNRGVRGENHTRVGRRQGALTVSIFSQVPVVTVEMVFLNNLHDANFIRSETGQDKMARALANGVMSYLHAPGRNLQPATCNLPGLPDRNPQVRRPVVLRHDPPQPGNAGT